MTWGRLSLLKSFIRESVGAVRRMLERNGNNTVIWSGLNRPVTTPGCKDCFFDLYISHETALCRN